MAEFGSLHAFGKELKKINKPIITEVPITSRKTKSPKHKNTQLPKRTITSDRKWEAFKSWAKGYFDTGYSGDGEALSDVLDAMKVLEERYP
jgi:hypothetical protein